MEGPRSLRPLLWASLLLMCATPAAGQTLQRGRWVRIGDGPDSSRGRVVYASPDSLVLRTPEGQLRTVDPAAEGPLYIKESRRAAATLAVLVGGVGGGVLGHSMAGTSEQPDCGFLAFPDCTRTREVKDLGPALGGALLGASLGLLLSQIGTRWIEVDGTSALSLGPVPGGGVRAVLTVPAP
ncbi:MAG: hypothetical protein R3E98_07225 [Gemmatimonadota bacterium]|nr:hypothetical protein [Gemmatimonadota bacterium]